MVIDVCTGAILVIEPTKQIGFPAPCLGHPFWSITNHGEKDDKFPWNLEKHHVFFRQITWTYMEDDMYIYFILYGR